MTMSGGTGMYKRNELERLYRDVRCGGFHPANSAAHARDHRQDGVRHRHRRPAALGLSGAQVSPATFIASIILNRFHTLS